MINPVAIILQLSIGSLIGAIILRAAVALYAKMSGSSRAVNPSLQSPAPVFPSDNQYPPTGQPQVDPNPTFQGTPNSPYAPPMTTATSYAAQMRQRGFPNELPFGLAFRTILIVNIVNSVLQFAVGFAAGAMFQPRSMSELQSLMPLILIVWFILSFFATSAIFMGMLKIPKFSTAMLIYLLYLLIAIAIGIGIVLVIFVVISGVSALG